MDTNVWRVHYPSSDLFLNTRLLKLINEFIIELIACYTWWQTANSRAGSGCTAWYKIRVG